MNQDEPSSDSKDFRLQPAKTEADAFLSKGVRKWSAEETEFVRKYYPQKGGGYVAEKIGRTRTSVNALTVRLGIRRSNFRKWKEWEVHYLQRHYGAKPIDSIARTLRRTVSALQLKAGELRITTPPPARYSQQEKDIIRELYESGSATVSEIAQRLGRPASAIRTRIGRWGLRSPLFWTKEEWNYVKKHYRTMSVEEIGRVLGRSAHAVTHYATRHGLKKAKRNSSPGGPNQASAN